MVAAPFSLRCVRGIASAARTAAVEFYRVIVELECALALERLLNLIDCVASNIVDVPADPANRMVMVFLAAINEGRFFAFLGATRDGSESLKHFESAVDRRHRGARHFGLQRLMDFRGGKIASSRAQQQEDRSPRARSVKNAILCRPRRQVHLRYRSAPSSLRASPTAAQRPHQGASAVWRFSCLAACRSRSAMRARHASYQSRPKHGGVSLFCRQARSATFIDQTESRR